jgi:hypothetical protein
MVWSKCRHVIATSEEGGRKRDVPGISATRSDIGDGSLAPPSCSRDPSSTPRTPGRISHGHSLPGPWPRRPRPFPPAELVESTIYSRTPNLSALSSASIRKTGRPGHRTWSVRRPGGSACLFMAPPGKAAASPWNRARASASRRGARFSRLFCSCLPPLDSDRRSCRSGRPSAPSRDWSSGRGCGS